MRIEFREVQAEAEMRSLIGFDRKVFRPSDRFPAAYWRNLESYWMLVGKVKVGCCAFDKNVDFQEDLKPDLNNPSQKGTLHVATTGILPRFQSQGFGRMLKSFEICYARRNRFRRVVTNVRKRNTRMIRLNEKFGFKVVRTTPGCYSAPADAAVVMELRLK